MLFVSHLHHDEAVARLQTINKYRCICNYGVRLRREVNSTLSYNDHRGLGRPRRMLETQINKTEFFDCEQREMQDVRLAES